MKFELTILGCSGALPFKDRFPTAHVLNIREQLLLIDCGEGTQIQMGRFGIKRGKIKYVFISHLHGDHVFGLPGVLSSFALNNRTEPLTIFSPPGLQEMVDAQFPYDKEKKGPGFDIHYITTDPSTSKVILETEDFTVTTIPLKHRVPCNGYLFQEKPKARKMRKEKIEEYDIPFDKIKGIKEGNDFTLEDGAIIPHAELTTASAPPRSYAFCSDTAYTEDIIPIIKDVDLLYHEATFLQADKDKADLTFHSTTIEAATIAKKANAKALVVGHYSARYESLEGHLAECRSVFEETFLGKDGAVFGVG